MRMKPGYSSQAGATGYGDIALRRDKEIVQRPIRDRALQEIQPAIPDEVKASQDYFRLADILDNLGERQMADQIRGIARDEIRHHGILLAIQAKLQQMTW